MKLVKFKDAAEFHHPEVPYRVVKILASPEYLGTKNVSIGLAVIGPGVRVPLHKHESEELMFVLHGEGKWFTKDKEYIVGPYTLIYVPAGEEHGFENVSTCQTLEFLFIYAPPGAEKSITEVWKKVSDLKFEV